MFQIFTVIRLIKELCNLTSIINVYVHVIAIMWRNTLSLAHYQRKHMQQCDINSNQYSILIKKKIKRKTSDNSDRFFYYSM